MKEKMREEGKEGNSISGLRPNCWVQFSPSSHSPTNYSWEGNWTMPFSITFLKDIYVFGSFRS